MFSVPLWNSVPAYLCAVTSSTLGSRSDLTQGTCTRAHTQKKKSLFESVVNPCSPNPLSNSHSPPPVSLMTGMQLEKYLAAMTWKSARLTLSMSLALHFLHSSFTSAGHNAPLSKAFCVISTVSSLISAWSLPHSWNSWDCGDQVACEATQMI